MKRLDAHGDRMKSYEKQKTESKFLRGVPLYARIDGRGFSKFTKGMNRPYDADMSSIMVKVTKYLVEETGALTGYTQSDEISLCWLEPDIKKDIFFSYKKQKMISTLSALATAKFVELALVKFESRCKKRLPTFDCRMFSLPNEYELMNCFFWRYKDAIKNSISMAAGEVCDPKPLEGKSSQERKALLLANGIRWEDYPQFFKEGTFIKKYAVKKVNSELVEFTRHKFKCVDLRFSDLSTEDRISLIINKLGGTIKE